MLEYEFETVSACKGAFVGKSLYHREAILRWAKEGWRYCGWVPASQINGFIATVDLIFERETEEKA